MPMSSNLENQIYHLYQDDMVEDDSDMKLILVLSSNLENQIYHLYQDDMVEGDSEMEIDISFISEDQDELEQDGIHDLSPSSHSENLDYSRYYCESDSSPGPSHNIPQLDTESRSMSGSDSSLNPLHQIPQSDAESSSMCGSYDTISSDEELGDADDPVSKIWWKDNSKSGDSASVEN